MSLGIRKTKRKTYRLVFLDEKGRRCTTFLDTHSRVVVEDVTKKLKQNKRFVVKQSPSLGDTNPPQQKKRTVITSVICSARS